MSSPPPPDAESTSTVGGELVRQLAALQAELAATKTETAAKVASLEDTIANLAHENTLLRRRLYGNRTERSSPARQSCRRRSTMRSARSRTQSSPSPSRRVRGARPRPGGI